MAADQRSILPRMKSSSRTPYRLLRWDPEGSKASETAMMLWHNASGRAGRGGAERGREGPYQTFDRLTD